MGVRVRLRYRAADRKGSVKHGRSHYCAYVTPITVNGCHHDAHGYPAWPRRRWDLGSDRLPDRVSSRPSSTHSSFERDLSYMDVGRGSRALLTPSRLRLCSGGRLKEVSGDPLLARRPLTRSPRRSGPESRGDDENRSQGFPPTPTETTLPSRVALSLSPRS